ncbi:hypothetical protein EOM39_03545 [Candidatus Gracilibacteria bacterium]|nr:hypothetical protein [Candidatus Gracilibacteria bacterium]
MEIFNKKAFTFVELIVSITISVIIFIIIFSFVVDSISNLAIANKKAGAMANFYDIYDTIGEYRNDYILGSLVINNDIGSGSDVALINNIHYDKGIVFGIIDKNTMKLESGSLYNTYSDKVFGYKDLSLSEISSILINSGSVYDLSFNDAKIFDTPVKGFQADFFNTGRIFLVDLELLISHNPNFDGKLWADIPSSDYEIFKLSFNF